MNITIASVWQVLPTALLSVVFLVPYLTGEYLPLTSDEFLSVIVQIEWLVMACGLFLVFALVFPVTSTTGRVLVLGYVLLVSSAVASSGAWEVNRWAGVLMFYLLLFFSYGLRVLLPFNPGGYGEPVFFLLRWVFLLFLYFGLAGFVGMPERVESWDGDEAALLGALFFAALAVLDLTLFSWLRQKLDASLLNADGQSEGEVERAAARKRLFGIKDD